MIVAPPGVGHFGPCRQEIPVLKQIALQFAKKNVLVLGVNSEEPEEVVRSFATKNKLCYPVLLTVSPKYSKLSVIIEVDRI